MGRHTTLDSALAGDVSVHIVCYYVLQGLVRRAYGAGNSALYN